MFGGDGVDGGPRSVIVVGAGIVGLSTAWFLQERGVEVTVVDRGGVAAGASWGNAGWVSPALTIPLNQPSVLGYGLRSLANPAAPLHVPARADIRLWSFLTRFAANCRRSSWDRAVAANLPFNAECLEAFDVLTGNGVDVPTTDCPITAVFTSERQAAHLLDELRALQQAGQDVSYRRLTLDELEDQVPLASRAVTVGVSVEDQRFVDPGRFTHALARAVVARGATISEVDVVDLLPHRRGVRVYPRTGAPLTADAAVIATGAWISALADRWVRTPVRAGRGYSFTVPVDRPVPGPIYLPEVRVACTPYRGALRVAGTMEFRGPDEPAIPARVEAIVGSTAPLFDGVRWGERTDEWVGPRPVTPDGRPLIGNVDRNVYVAGGHGMWGLAHGPVTGRLLAEQITTGKQPEALRAVDPLR
ncbi:NAD(P)/FAD-dependent oxidoreductase [Mycolicibacterium monacense]|uniref:D-amino-acid dehydrogenase n=2 Tax=Mycobacteriaceae TaxID=1762 RepID=A0AAD1J0Y9_MYCMB|nr:FAD-dependent oxidoreductase [Mycolicibacterium monacense]MDA4103327.1 D-amino acid dehydrogenase [Mycolicibacterium monacense DSM 44395]ORB21150.1 amino acid dehydrogenase [Mycolicibacterium monacense DSM 44395]QHP88919.1 FAD-binding oxidoreductase [Mycolicibacterium monacense DSM 44395]BBZ63615.1 D-amino-acid dehydrogenase [Mycolicibacterium monacense]